VAGGKGRQGGREKGKGRREREKRMVNLDFHFFSVSVKSLR
jgi:hypothetical protein